MSKTKLLTRKQIIDLWSKQSEEHLNSLCCPHCRNILLKLENSTLMCNNQRCDDVKVFDLKGNMLYDLDNPL